MPTTLTSFPHDFDPTILDRGRRYYDDGRVLGLEEVDANHWQAEVDGTYPYTVTITIAANDALAWSCTCPYDLGPVCKHVVATLFAIRTALDPATAPKPAAAPKPRPKRPTRADKVRAAISPLSHDDLVTLLVELSTEDRHLANQLLARYSPPSAEKPAARQLVKDALRFGRDRHGFLDYSATMEAGRAVDRLVARADGLLAAGQTQAALALYQAILEEVVPALQEADDSSGMLGGCASYALIGLENTAAQLSPAERTTLFDYCLSEKMAERLAGWDWSWDLLKLGSDLMATPDQRMALFAALDRAAARNADEVWNSGYDRARAAAFKLDVIREQDGDEAARAFMHDHLDLYDMRRKLVHFCLERDELDTARELCQAWLDDPSNTMAGLRYDFLTLLLDIAERSGDRAEELRLLQESLLVRGDMDTFRRIKALVGPEAWPDVRPGLITRLAQEGHRPDLLGAVYAAEEMWPELLALANRAPHLAKRWRAELGSRFPAELCALFAHQAAQALGSYPTRTQYRDACDWLQAMQEVDPAAAAAEVARWREEHKKRPALQDELNKAFGPAAS